MDDGKQPQEPWPAEKPATTEDLASLDALVELSWPGPPSHTDTHPMGSNRRLLRNISLTLMGLSALAVLIFVVLGFTRASDPPVTPATAPTAATSVLPTPNAQPVPTPTGAQPTPAASPTASRSVAPVTLRLRTKWGPYAPVTLLGDNGEGTIRIAQVPSARGTWTWVGRDLLIRYTGRITLGNGRRVETGAKITCTGLPTSARFPCRIRTEAFGTTKTTLTRQWVTLKAVGRPS